MKRVRIVVRGGVAELARQACGTRVEIADYDNGTRNRPQTVVFERPLRKAEQEALAIASGAIDSLRTQIEQMKGMFPDDDGAIASALRDADDAERAIGRARRAGT